MDSFFDRKFWLLLSTFILIEIASAVAFFVSPLAVVFSLLIFVAVLWLSLIKLEWGMVIVLMELVVGGLGYLFALPIGDFSLSIRLIIFVAVMLAWLISLIKNRNLKPLQNKYLYALLPFLGCLILALVLALLTGRPFAGIYSDANNYLFLFLLLPALYSRLKLETVVKVILAGSWLTALKTATVLFLFSHHIFVLHDGFYKLIRDTGVGEIALISEPLFRIFFQSHFYNLIALFLALGLLFFIAGNRWQKVLLGLTVWLNCLVLLISQSRTFWLTAIVGLIIFAGWLIVQKKPKQIFSLLLLLAGCLISGHLVLNLLIGDFNINLFYSRLNEGNATAGVSSRSAQIAPALATIIKSPIIGSGFNQTITYKSSDPRIKNNANPEGIYTTDALELGYLDIALKMGILGLLSYALFLLTLLFNLYQKSAMDKRLIGVLIGLLVLLMIHALTPYLNHPLGIGYLIVIVALLL